MSYFDDASLVFIPSGTKVSKAYSVKPIDGTGDLTFTRSNDTASRVASNGLIEKVRTNLVLHSEAFDNAYWTKTNTTITANATTAPDGSLTADKLVETAALGDHAVARVGGMSAAGVYALSVFAKAGERTRIAIGNSSAAHYAIFDLSLGTVVQASQGTVTNGTISSIDANGFYRVSCTITVASAASVVFNLVSTGTTISYTGDGTSGLFIWGAQLETGDIATDYIATTSAAVSVGPVANVPRLDYLNSSCPKLILEPQRVNLALFSEQINNAYWTKSNTTITANTSATLDPTGANGADKIVETATTAFHVIERAFGTLSGSHSLSVFAKAAERNWVYLEFFTGATSFTSFFDLSNGTIGTSAAGNNAKIENYGNGWYRLSISRAAGSGTSFFVAGLSNADNVTSYTGNGTSGAYFYGCGLEAGAYATSYIPTLGAAVTRGVDLAVDTAASSLIGQTEGTIYAEVNFDSNVNTEGYIVRLDDTSFNDTVVLSRGNDKRLNSILRAGGSTIVNIQQDNFNGLKRVAFAYKSGSFAVYVDGVQVGTSAATYTNGITYGEVRIGGFDASTANMSGGISKVLLFKTRLTNAQLAELTTI